MVKYQATSICTTAPMGAGKTYARCAWFLSKQYLPERRFVDDSGADWPRVHISNFPVNVEAMADYVAGEDLEFREECVGRIERIPDDVLESWEREESGPWEYFAGRNLRGCHIAIDEAHKYVGREHKPKHRQAWAKWLGELRHDGAQAEFISQHISAIAKDVVSRCGIRIVLTSSEDRRDPFLGVRLVDWYEVRAGFTGRYSACVWVEEQRQVGEKWVVQRRVPIWLMPELFGLYDSYNVSGSRQSGGRVHEYERGLVHVLVWFLRRNWWAVSSRVAAAVALGWFFFGGGLVWAIESGTEWIQGRARGVQVLGTVPDSAPLSAAPESLPGAPAPLPAAPAPLPAVSRAVESGRGRGLVGGMIESVSGVVGDGVGGMLGVGQLGRVRVAVTYQGMETVMPSRTGGPWDIVRLSEDSVMFRNGEVMRPGDSCNEGPYEGLTLEEVDVRGRCIRFPGIKVPIKVGRVVGRRVLEGS